MVVEAADTVNLTNVYALNGTAARLWQQAEALGDFTAEALAGQLCEEYEVDGETALRDVQKQLAEWADFGLLE